MNLGRYIKSLVPAILSVINVVEDWAVSGKLDLTHLRLSVVLLLVAAVVYWLPNTPAPATPAVPVVPETWIDARLRTDAGARPLGGND